MIDIDLIQSLASRMTNEELLALREQGFRLVQIANGTIMRRRYAELPQEVRDEVEAMLTKWEEEKSKEAG